MFSESVNNVEFEKKIEATIEQILDRKFGAIISEKIDKALRENDALQSKKLSLIERIVRVEEELKALREVESAHFNALMREMNTRFEATDKRFEAMDKRFEAMDKRFEALQREMNARFEAMDKRFEAMEKRFEALQREMNARFEAMDKRFEATEKRFETIDKRFEAIEKRFNMLQWTIGIGFSFITLIMGILKFWQ